MKAHLNREKDRELYKLAQYLKEIGKLDDFTGLNHKHWERSETHKAIQKCSVLSCQTVVFGKITTNKTNFYFFFF